MPDSPIVEIWWGKTRTGKTKTWYDQHFEDGYVYDDRFFDTYQNEKFLLLDMFFYEHMQIKTLMSLLDSSGKKLKTKCRSRGGFKTSNWNNVTIIMLENPETIYPNAESTQREALFAKISKIKHFTDQGIQEYQSDLTVN